MIKFRFWYQKNDPLYARLVEEIRRADAKGYSAIEIARVLGQSKRHTYALMRDEGIIAKIQRKRQKPYRIPDRLGKILSKCEISFLQWCSSHNLDAERTSEALKKEEKPDCPVSTAVHAALRQDFPKAYSKILDPEPEYSTSWQPRIEELKTDYTITIKLNPETNGYAAFIHELEECSVEAPTRDEAYYRLKSRYVAYSSINKLQMLPSKQR